MIQHFALWCSNLQVLKLCTIIPGTQTNATRTGWNIHKWTSRHRNRQRNCALILSKHLLYIIARQTIPTMVIIINQVDWPTLMLHIAEQRSVCSHSHQIGIALQSRHKCSFTNGTSEVTLSTLTSYGILTNKHFFSSTLAIVIFIGIEYEPIWRIIIMLVNHRMRRS